MWGVLGSMFMGVVTGLVIGYCYGTHRAHRQFHEAGQFVRDRLLASRP